MKSNKNGMNAIVIIVSIVISVFATSNTISFLNSVYKSTRLLDWFVDFGDGVLIWALMSAMSIGVYIVLNKVLGNYRIVKKNNEVKSYAQKRA